MELCYPAVMRKFLAAWILLSLLVCASPADAESVLLVTNEYEPYVSTSTQRKGFLHEVVVAAFREAGVEARIEYRPWRRCALMVRNGGAFAAFPYAKTEERAGFSMFSDVIWKCRNVFFYLKGRMGCFEYTDLAALRPYRIAGTSGHYYESIFQETGLEVDYAPGEASGAHKIQMMRTHLFAEDELVGWNLISRIFPEQRHLFASTGPWNIQPQHLMVSKVYPDAAKLLERFNKGLAAIRENGIYDRILSSYFMK